MNTLLNTDREEDLEDFHRRPPVEKDREITLGTTVILGIFLALAVFGAAAFGFGYSMGTRHAPAAVAAADAPTGMLPPGAFKPAPGVAASPAEPPTPAHPSASSVTVPLGNPNPPAATPKAPAANVDDAQGTPTVEPPAHNAAATGKPALPAIATTAAPGVMVQVAAVSHPEDADLLVTSLKRLGYAVAIHTEPQDKLLHVQIGPLATRKDADAMRQRLLADGFNAIVK